MPVGTATRSAVEYRALVGDLARAGYVDEIPGRTSGEERAQVAEIAPRLGEAGRAVSSEFDVAADTFDVAWFDDGVVTRGDDERFLAGGGDGARRRARRCPSAGSPLMARSAVVRQRWRLGRCEGRRRAWSS